MSWHDQSPWRAKRSEAVQTVTERLAAVEKSLRAGDIDPHRAVLAAYQIGIEAGRANPAVQKIGEGHTPEVMG